MVSIARCEMRTVRMRIKAFADLTGTSVRPLLIAENHIPV